MASSDRSGGVAVARGEENPQRWWCRVGEKDRAGEGWPSISLSKKKTLWTIQKKLEQGQIYYLPNWLMEVTILSRCPDDHNVPTSNQMDPNVLLYFFSPVFLNWYMGFKNRCPQYEKVAIFNLQLKISQYREGRIKLHKGKTSLLKQLSSF